MKKIAFTIVLNGMPFIERQAEIIPEVFDEWHIIEGATYPVYDTNWCKIVPSKYYNNENSVFKGCSVDGTMEFLNSLSSKKKNVFVHRKGDIWHGKKEMCSCIDYLMSDCILMQIDVDEMWKPDILKNIFEYCEQNEGFDGMIFPANFYVGPDLVIRDENTFPNKQDVWCRLWKIKNKTEWISHEPPRIKGLTRFLNKKFTSSKGWIFDHYAYVTDYQLKFKEDFYGYVGAVESWRKMQLYPEKTFKLNKFFEWAKNDDIVERI